jgi:leucyl aminopeptidase
MARTVGIIVMTATVLTCGLLANDEKATIEKMKEEVYEEVKSAANMQRELVSKVYQGDLASILKRRAEDIKASLQIVESARAKAIHLAERTGDPNNIKMAVQQVIREKTNAAKQAEEGRLIDFVLQAEKLLNDPNHLPDPNDLEEQRRLLGLRLDIYRVLQSNGGGL